HSGRCFVSIRKFALVVVASVVVACSAVPERKGNPTHADLLIRHGVLYDGSGGAPLQGDLAIRGERVVQVGDLRTWTADQTVDANGLAVAPGFINMLSWATESLIY